MKAAAGCVTFTANCTSRYLRRVLECGLNFVYCADCAIDIFYAGAGKGSLGGDMAKPLTQMLNNLVFAIHTLPQVLRARPHLKLRPACQLDGSGMLRLAPYPVPGPPSVTFRRQ